MQLLPYDSTRDRGLPWEGKVAAAIEKTRGDNEDKMDRGNDVEKRAGNLPNSY